MAFTVKSIINNAYDRSGVFPNSTSTLPGEMCEGALEVLKGIINTYNIQGILLPTQTREEFEITKPKIIISKRPDAQAQVNEDIAAISKLYVKENEESAYELDYIPFKDFDAFPNSYNYSYNQTRANEFELYFKKNMVGRTAILHFMRPIECELNTEYYLPFEYEELFTLSLVVKLLTMYPRENDKQQENFKEELASVRNAIVSKQAENKLQMYNRHAYNSMWELGNSGRYLGV